MRPIKLLKNIYLLLILIAGSSAFAQIHDPKNAPYVGIWENHADDKIFRLIIWEDAEPNPHDGYFYLNGHYEMLQIDGNNNRSVVYTSDPAEFGDNQKLPSAFFGDVYVSNDGSPHFGGSFRQIHAGGGGLSGNFVIEKLAVCPSCPSKIKWTVRRGEGVNFQPIGPNPPVNKIVVPSNIELTKI